MSVTGGHRQPVTLVARTAATDCTSHMILLNPLVCSLRNWNSEQLNIPYDHHQGDEDYHHSPIDFPKKTKGVLVWVSGEYVPEERAGGAENHFMSSNTFGIIGD